MIGKRITLKVKILCSFLSIAVLVGAYSYMAHLQHIDNPENRTIPTLGQLWEGVIFLCRQPDPEEDDSADLLAAALADSGITDDSTAEEKGFLEERILWEASKATLKRLFAGLFIGLVGGVFIGIFMGCFLKIDASLSPIMYFASRIIPTAAMPIFFILAGIEFEMYVAMIAFGSMPLITLTVSQYVQEFPNELRYKAYTLGASHFEVITTAIFPYILPKVIDLTVLMIGPALVYLIASEQIVAGEGFGYRIRVLTKATRFEVVYPLIIILTLYAGIMTYVLKFLQKKLCPWYKLKR